MSLSIKELARATSSTAENAAIFQPHLNAAMLRFQINTPQRVAAFLANVAIESSYLTKTEEDLFYRTAERLVKIYPRAFLSVAEAEPYVKNSRGLSQKLYAGFHGRGLLQTTWERNYIATASALGIDCHKNPALLKEPKHAADAAAWFFSSNGCNAAADNKDIDLVRRRINGPAKLHMLEVAALFGANLKWMETAA